MYILGLILRNSAELAEAVPFESSICTFIVQSVTVFRSFDCYVSVSSDSVVTGHRWVIQDFVV